MATKRVQVSIKGKSPLLMHRFPLEPIEALEKKPPMEQAEIAAYRCPDTGELYIPGIAIQRALIAGATFTKGKGRASLQKEVAASVFVSPERLLLGTKVFILDSRGVVIPATKGRVIRHRPRLDEWQVSFALEYEDTLVTETNLRKILDDTCERVGFLDFRPANKGPYGRAMVTNWTME